MTKNSSIRTQLFAVLLAAFLVRIYVAVTTHIPLQSDSHDYYSLATNLVQLHEYSINGAMTAYRPPAYPLFLSAVLTISQTETSAKLAQAFLETVNCLLLFALGKKLISDRAGIIAAILWALFPVSIVQSAFLLTEPLFTTLALGIVLLLVSNTFVEQWKPILIGLLFGCAILTKPQSALFIIVIIGYAKIQIQQKRQFVHFSIRLISGVALVLTPWIVRNAVMFGEPLLSTNGGVNFWIGHNEEANGSYKIPKVNPLDSIANEIERSKVGYHLGWMFMRTEPKKEAILLLQKFGYFLSSQAPLAVALQETPSNNSYRAQARQSSLFMLFILNAQYMFYLLCGTVGFIVAYNKKETVYIFFLISLIIWTALHLIYFTISRYNFPMLPFVVLWCAHLFYNRNQLVLVSKYKLFAIIFCVIGLLVLWGIEFVMIFATHS